MTSRWRKKKRTSCSGEVRKKYSEIRIPEDSGRLQGSVYGGKKAIYAGKKLEDGNQNKNASHPTGWLERGTRKGKRNWAKPDDESGGQVGTSVGEKILSGHQLERGSQCGRSSTGNKRPNTGMVGKLGKKHHEVTYRRHLAQIEGGGRGEMGEERRKRKKIRGTAFRGQMTTTSRGKKKKMKEVVRTPRRTSGIKRLKRKISSKLPFGEKKGGQMHAIGFPWGNYGEKKKSGRPKLSTYEEGEGVRRKRGGWRKGVEIVSHPVYLDSTDIIRRDNSRGEVRKTTTERRGRLQKKPRGKLLQQM